MESALREEPSDETMPNEKEIVVSGIWFATGEAVGERLELADRDVVGELVKLAVLEVEGSAMDEGLRDALGVEDGEGDGIAVGEGEGVGDGGGDGPSWICTALAPEAVTLLR